jgi:DNA repair protein RadA/Sms
VARIPVGLAELDRTLGGGLVPGEVVLLGGEPGIGKSTLVLEAAAGVARGATGSGDDAGPVLYASGEESIEQLHLRADRLGVTQGAAGDGISVLGATELEAILSAADTIGPRLLVIDSVQTLTADGLEGPAGSVGQVREAAARIGGWARDRGVPVILVGHVTKDGTLAGPRTLEHLVDAVLLLEGDRYGPLRLLRAAKNRFGSTEEVGVLQMTGEGLREVPDPGRAFLGDALERDRGTGVAVAGVLEGSRPLLVEVQALVAPNGMGMPRRTVAGLDANRLALLVAVLGRRCGLSLGAQDLYVSLAGGASVDDPGLDLPLAMALASSSRDDPVLPATMACGEVSLLGELRAVRGLDRRLREAARLGFKRAIVPASGLEQDHARTSSPRIGGIEVIGARTLSEALARTLSPLHSTSGEG